MFIEFYSVFGKNWKPKINEQISYMEYVIDLIAMLHTFCGLSNGKQFQAVKNIISEKFRQEFEEATNVKYDIDACQFMRKEYLQNIKKTFNHFTWICLGRRYLEEQGRLEENTKKFQEECDNLGTVVGLMFKTLTSPEYAGISPQVYWDFQIKKLKEMQTHNADFVISDKFICDLVDTAIKAKTRERNNLLSDKGSLILQKLLQQN